MKNLARKATILLLGVAVELTMLAAPLAGTVYAEEKPPAVHDADKGHNGEIKDERDQNQRGKDEHHDRDGVDHDRDHGKDWHSDRDHGKDWQRDGDRANYRRWDRGAFNRHMAMYREWLMAHQAAVVDQSPVTAVMSAAGVLGFDVNSDTFTLVSQNASQAVVQVTHDGGTFSITLNNANGVWTVAEMVQV